MESSDPEQPSPASNSSPYAARPPGFAQRGHTHPTRPSATGIASSRSNPSPSSHSSSVSRYTHGFSSDNRDYFDNTSPHRAQGSNEYGFGTSNYLAETGFTTPPSSISRSAQGGPFPTSASFDLNRSSAGAGRGGRQPVQMNRPQSISISQTPGQWSSTTRMPRNTINLPHSPPTASGILLVSPRERLPDRFRSVIPYQFLNAVQSKCFPWVYESDDNLVVSAPTGSGKTVIMELAICRLVVQRGRENFKIVYQAPTKALCSERSRDWKTKFSVLNMDVAELTGDTSQAEMKRVSTASIIVTTPEKWDSITRKWHDYRKLLQFVELFLIDEVHILKDVRGATLEAVVSRMKAIGTSVRFVALSATVPNSDDIANWLGQNHANPRLPARLETFGKDLRPVKLKKYVYGYDYRENPFMFDKYLNSKLPDLLAEHARSKPILVFCFTRGSCQETAKRLGECWAASAGDNKLWPAPSQRVVVANQLLQQTVRWGVAFHHAGLDAHDRSLVERNFLDGQINVICCTSTLAVGMNLPCHTVVLKGTCGYQDGGHLKEYSDLEVMQMLGRAGRPQFDDTANAIILTRNPTKNRYEQMVSGQEVLESTLHLNLIEHLNSEVVLRTIDSLRSAERWLRKTFLSVRLRRNPEHYQLTSSSSDVRHRGDTIVEICNRDIKLLQEAGLVTTDHPTFKSTDYGRAMSSYMVRFDSMKLILDIPTGVGVGLLLITLSRSSEFKDQRFKAYEKAMYRELNESPLIRYPIKENVSETWHKVSLLVQVHLGALELPNHQDHAAARRQISTDKRVVFECMQRLVRCFVDCSGAKRDGVGTRIGLELSRSLAAESWEEWPTQLLQVAGIGPVGMRKLVNQGVRDVKHLTSHSYMDIERLLSRNPPFGKKLIDLLDGFPRLAMSVDIVNHQVSPGGVDVNVRASLGYLNPKIQWKSSIPRLTFMAETTGGSLAYFWRGTMNKLNNDSGTELKFSARLDGRDDLTCHFSCEEVVGTTISTTIRYDGPRGGGGTGEQTYNLGRIEVSSPHLSDTVETLEPSSPGILDDGEAEHNREPVQLPNGKWQCDHRCTGGVLTKKGRPCTHPCCRDGVEKKPRTKGRVRHQTAKRSYSSGSDNAASVVSPNGSRVQPRRQSVGKNSSKKRKLSRLSPGSKERPSATKAGLRNEASVASFSEILCIDLVDVDSDDDPGIRPLGRTTPAFNVQDEIVSSVKPRSLHDQETSTKSIKPHPHSLLSHEDFDSDGASQGFETDVFDDVDFASIDDLSHNVPERTAPSPFRPDANDTAVVDIGNRSLNTAISQNMTGRPSSTAEAIRKAAQPLDLEATPSYNLDHGGKLTYVDPKTEVQENSEKSGAAAGVMTDESSPDDSTISGRLSDMVDVMGTPATEILSRRDLDAGQEPSSTADARSTPPPTKQQDEPAWVQDFDPELVDSLRDYVKFV